MVEKRSFTDEGVSTSRIQNMGMSEETNTKQETGSSLLASFLKTCMKLLRDNKLVEGLQELIDNCTGKNNPIPKQCAIHKVGKSKKRIGREMILTTQIGEYEMDQVILDLGSDANVLPKQTWEIMGSPML